MNRIRPYLGLALVGGIVLALVGVSVLSMMGGKVSAVFTSINSGLGGGPGVPSSAGTYLNPAGGQVAQEPSTEGSTALEGGSASPSEDLAAAERQALQRLVIRNANLSLQVESAREAEAAVRAQVERLGGYVVTSETSGSDADMSVQITFRVPAARFDEALSGVQGLAKKVLARSISGQDVTEEFVDLEARLHNLEATRDRLQSFLDKANTVEDALRVNQSLSDIQGQIEQLEGRKQFLQQSAAFSTISVSLAPVPPVAPIVAEGGWQPLNVARGALRVLIGFGQVLANVMIVLAVWSPVWLPPLVWWLWRRLRGRRRLSGGPA